MTDDKAALRPTPAAADQKAELGDVDELALAQHAYAAFHGVSIEQAKLNWETRSEQCHEQWHAIVRSVRSILAAAPGDGMVRVPRVPTDKMMIMGGFRFAGRVPNEQVFPEVRKCWDDMIAAYEREQADVQAR